MTSPGQCISQVGHLTYLKIRHEAARRQALRLQSFLRQGCKAHLAMGGDHFPKYAAEGLEVAAKLEFLMGELSPRFLTEE